MNASGLVIRISCETCGALLPASLPQSHFTATDLDTAKHGDANMIVVDRSILTCLH
jgi:hypothetical protein